MWGSFGYELDVTRLTAEQKEEFKTHIAQYHKYNALIRFGELYRLLSPFEKGDNVAWSFVSEDKSECLLTVVCLNADVYANFILKLKGLDENAYYQEETSGKIYSGALLMNVGLNLSRQINDTYASKKWYFKKVK